VPRAMRGLARPPVNASCAAGATWDVSVGAVPPLGAARSLGAVLGSVPPWWADAFASSTPPGESPTPCGTVVVGPSFGPVDTNGDGSVVVVVGTTVVVVVSSFTEAAAGIEVVVGGSVVVVGDSMVVVVGGSVDVVSSVTEAGAGIEVVVGESVVVVVGDSVVVVTGGSVVLGASVVVVGGNVVVVTGGAVVVVDGIVVVVFAGAELTGLQNWSTSVGGQFWPGKVPNGGMTSSEWPA